MTMAETLTVNGKRFKMAGIPHEYREDPFPLFVWQVGDVELRKSVFQVANEETVVALYFLRAQGRAAKYSCQLEVQAGQSQHRVSDGVESAPGLFTFEMATQATMILSERNYTIGDAPRLRKEEFQRLRRIKLERDATT
jgi:hypothetical protein